MNSNNFFPKVINRFFAKNQRSKLRILLRAYRKLKVQGKMSQLHDLKGILADEKFDQINKQASKTLFGASSKNASLVVRQYTFNQLILKHRKFWNFNEAILYSLGSGKPVRCPIPKNFQDKLKEKGYKVDTISCNFQFFILLLVYFCFGIYRAFGLIKASKIMNQKSSSKLPLPFAYFHQLSLGNIPYKSDKFFSQTIITWYAQWQGRSESIKSLHHDVNVISEKELDDFSVKYIPITKLNIENTKTLIRFSWWVIKALLICIKNLFLLRWWTFLLFEQFVQAAIFRYVEDSKIAKDYLLPHNGVFYRPIWTYEAEKRYARIILYFYSTNNEQPKNIDGYIGPGLAWKLSNWPIVLVWNKYQEDFIKRSFFSYRIIEIVGPIWFTSYKNKSIKNNFSNKISAGIFDSQPFRLSKLVYGAPPHVYSDSKIAIQFLKDTHKVLTENSVVTLHKRKRDIGKNLDPKYRAVLKTFSGELQQSIDPAVNASDMIDIVDFVICMPFTSAAVLALEQKKPIIYYDPFGDIQKNDRAAHGIKIIIGIEELQFWVKDVVSELSMFEDNNL